LCSAHDDRQRSLSLAKGKHRVVIHCHAGCSENEVLAAAGLIRRDLYFAGDDRKLEPRDEKAWAEALDNDKWVWECVWRFLGQGLHVGRQAYRAPYELHNQINMGFLSRMDVAEDLHSEGLMALYRACCWRDPRRGTVAQYSAPIIGRALMRAVEEMIPEHGTGRARGQGLRRVHGYAKSRPESDDPTGDLVAEKVDSSWEDSKNDSPRILYSYQSISEVVPKASTREAKDKDKASHLEKKLKPKQLARLLRRPENLSAELAIDAADAVECLLRHGEEIARLELAISLANAKLREPGLPDEQRREIEAARRAAYRETQRLRSLSDT